MALDAPPWVLLNAQSYHLLVETPEANLNRSIGWLQTTYSVRFNRRHHRSGHLFQGRFKAHLVEADSCTKTLLGYFHLNPVRPRDKSALDEAHYYPKQRFKLDSKSQSGRSRTGQRRR